MVSMYKSAKHCFSSSGSYELVKTFCSLSKTARRKSYCMSLRQRGSPSSFFRCLILPIWGCASLSLSLSLAFPLLLEGLSAVSVLVATIVSSSSASTARETEDLPSAGTGELGFSASDAASAELGDAAMVRGSLRRGGGGG
ncbi:hypothetical protein TgHK011_008843 [Trichoderma gracile]|nr:hypothetical protein TgHK011_008843 [Trichoderma gracile]